MVAGGANPRKHPPSIPICALEGRGRAAGHLPPPRWGEWIHKGIRGPGARAGARPPATLHCPSGTTGARACRCVPESGVLRLLRLFAAIPLAGHKPLNPENLTEP